METYLRSLIKASICSPSLSTYILSFPLRASIICESASTTSITEPAVALGSIEPEALEDVSDFVLREELDDVGLYDGDAAIGLTESDRSVRKSGMLWVELAVVASTDGVAMLESGDLDEGRGEWFSAACADASVGCSGRSVRWEQKSALPQRVDKDEGTTRSAGPRMPSTTRNKCDAPADITIYVTGKLVSLSANRMNARTRLSGGASGRRVSVVSGDRRSYVRLQSRLASASIVRKISASNADFSNRFALTQGPQRQVHGYAWYYDSMECCSCTGRRQ